MRDTRLIMGMPVVFEVADAEATADDLEAVFAYLVSVDEQFSPYKDTSEVATMNRDGAHEPSKEMREVLAIAARTKEETRGFFDTTKPDGTFDPSGVVKGWAILNAANLLKERGRKNFFVDVGGDIQCAGVNAEGKPWTVGVRNPLGEGIVKVLAPGEHGVATSGTYVRGAHIYDPHTRAAPPRALLSLTVVAKDVLEADRYATAAFAMGADGLAFLESVPGVEAYGISPAGTATMTSGFSAFVAP